MEPKSSANAGQASHPEPAAGSTPLASTGAQRHGPDPSPADVESSGETPEGLERAASEYRALTSSCGGVELNSRVIAWCLSYRGLAEHARLFRDLHASDPSAAGRLAEGLTAMPRAGDALLGFHLIRELGRGAFGRVFLARQLDLADRPVALKVSPAPSDESRALAQLQHTNIVPIYSVHRAGSLQVVCMPYFGATTLRDVYDDLEAQDEPPASGRALLSTLYQRRSRAQAPPDARAVADGAAPSADADRGNAPEAALRVTETLRYLEKLTYVQAVLWVGSRLACGLAHAHERGILHRDLKPANVLLTDEGQPMLLDFNLAEDTKVRPGEAAAAAVGGTLHYMAPEHLRAFRAGSGLVDARGDLYSLGVILYELLSGRRPYGVPDCPDAMLIDRLIEDRRVPPPSARLWNRAATPAVDAILRRCLEPDPSRRYQSALQLHDDLERQLADRPLRHVREPSLAERGRKWVRRHPVACSSTSIGAATTGLIAALIVLGALLVGQLRFAEARLLHQKFRGQFDRCKLLLQTQGASPAQLDEANRLALQTLGLYRAGRPEGWTALPLVRALPPDERRALREEVSELVQLVARAAVRRAEREDTPGGVAAALRRAVAMLDEAERYDPDPPAALYELRGQYLSQLGDRARATRDRAAAARKPPRTPRDHELLGSAALARGDLDAAEGHLSHAVTRDPRRFWVWFALGICHSDQGRFGDAAHDFSVCTTLAPRFAWPHQNRGLALARAGRLLEARAAFDRAIELDPSFLEARMNRALTALELDDPAAALVDLDALLGLERGGPEVLTTRAEALARLGRAAEAARAYDEAIRERPDAALPLVSRGFARVFDDPRAADLDFQRALVIEPQHARAWLGRAYVVRRDDPRTALVHAERALAADPGLGDALQLRALLRARLGDPGAASDVERLLQVPTPRRLYNAACALALLARRDDDPQLIADALDLLRRALRSGLSPRYLSDDPDLDALRGQPGFAELLTYRPATGR
jgi:serine/threonine protein kinase/Tfp pilus assembly protein PilF